ncbi:MAG: hypothetical protein ABR520_08170, partial [Mycobacteriales bacterium]
LGVAMQVLTELSPVRTPKALTRTITAAIAIGVAYLLDYSVFEAFGQVLRSQWMHPVFTGIVLTAVADLVATVSTYLSGRAGKAVNEAAEIEHRIPRAA